MTDINKVIMNQGAYKDDPDGNLAELEPWSDQIALSIASQEGIELSDQHWSIIHFLRDHYREHGPAEHARDLTHLLEQRFAEEGGKRLLYRLFPHGPVTQGSKIAGLPVPPHSSNPSLGSVE